MSSARSRRSSGDRRSAAPGPPGRVRHARPRHWLLREITDDGRRVVARPRPHVLVPGGRARPRVVLASGAGRAVRASVERREAPPVRPAQRLRSRRLMALRATAERVDGAATVTRRYGAWLVSWETGCADVVDYL